MTGAAQRAGGVVTARIAALPPQKQAELLARLRQQRPVASSPDAWVVRHRPDPKADLRLFCFSYAGGGASMFRSWSDGLPPEAEVCAVALPGRESRIGELPYRRLTPLVEALADAVEPYLDRPFAFFGHSMGALVAFELARHLRRTSKPQPVRLTLAAFRAPQLPNPNISIHHLPDEVFKVVLRSEGVPETILQSDELMQAVLPTLRADLELCDTYEYSAEPPLGCPLSIFGGLGDVRISASDLAGWRTQATTVSGPTMFPGSHFFVHSAHDLVLAEVGRDMVGDVKSAGAGSHA